MAKKRAFSRDLTELILELSFSKRCKLRSQIENLQQLVGSKEDFFTDRRHLTWADEGPGRRTIAQRPFNNLRQKVLLTWNSGAEEIRPFLEAAAMLGLRPSSLRVYMSRGKGAYYTQFNDQMLVVTYIKEDDDD